MMKMCDKVEGMTLEQVDKIMEFIDREVVEGVKIDFFGGEPLLRFDLIRHVVEKYPMLDYGLSTNAILLTDEMVEFFKKHKDSVLVQLSLDGTVATQIKNRGQCPDYGLIKRVLNETQSTVRMVVDDPWKLHHDVEFIVGLGAKIIKVGIPIFKVNSAGYKGIFLDQLEEAKTKFPGIKIEPDSMSCEQACYATNTHIAFSPNGDIYPCDIFYFKNMFKIGDITTGIDKEAIRKFQEDVKDSFDPDVPCLAHKMFMKDSWINQ
jgi:uncharacterized protein